MKVAEQAAHLAATKVSIAVGTPARIAKLITEGKPISLCFASVCRERNARADFVGALKLTKSTVLLLDIGHRDSSAYNCSSRKMRLETRDECRLTSRNPHVAHYA